MSFEYWLSVAIALTTIEKVMHRYYLADSNYHWEYLTGYNVGALVGVFILSSHILPTVELDAIIIGLLIISGFFWFLMNYAAFRADQYVEASISSVIEQLQLVLIFLGGILFFQEQVSLFKIVGSVIIFIGLTSLFFKKDKQEVSKKGIIFKSISVLAISIALLIDKSLTDKIDPAIVTISGYLVPTIVTLGIRPGSMANVVSVTKKVRFGNIWLGTLGCFAYYSLIKAFQLAEVSIVFPLFQIHVVLIVIVSYLFLSEKKLFLQKVFASILILGGSTLLKAL